MSDLVKLCGLWKMQSGKGLSGKLTYGTKLIVLKNDRKEEGSNHPDYNVFVAPYSKDGGDVPNHNPTSGDDDIPF